MNEFNSLWVEKYRPSTLDDIILSDENRVIVEKFSTEQAIPNLLMCGCPGTGKTSLAYNANIYILMRLMRTA